MADREDIDALLIGRLYGELSSADDARLQAHLAGTTAEALADRGSLEDLTHARSMIRENRLLHEQAEPPQSISALLMQEAARRAPKRVDERDGWFARFTHSFLQHPAMAAAATLVLVVGVAGALYSRKGDHFAAQHKESAPAAISAGAPADQATSANGDPASLSLSTTETATGALAQGGAADALVGGIDGKGSVSVALTEGRGGATTGADQAPREERKAQSAPARVRGIEVTTPQAEPKDFDRRDEEAPAARKPMAKSRDAVVADDARDSGASVAADAAGMASGGAPAKAGARPALPPAAATEKDAKRAAPKADAYGGAYGGGGAPAPAPTTATPPTAPPPPPAQVVTDGEVAWARSAHQQVVAQARAKRCDDAAATAESIAKRARAYYDDNVRSDRDLKGCMTLIAQQREKAEAVQRAKAAKQARPEPAGTTKSAPSGSK